MATSDDTHSLFVRIPRATAQQLDAAASARGASKRQLVTEFIGHGLGMARGGGAVLDHGHASSITYAGSTEILTLEEAAEVLRVDPKDLRALAEAGQLPARRIGKEWRISRAALLAWLGAYDSSGGFGGGGRRGNVVGFASGPAAEQSTDTGDRS